jgi:methylase of polypeptide subunit release factors
MAYPQAAAVGSALFPKLLGSYERELHPWIERICRGQYTEIIDVGCAEGYYAVGLARRLPNVKVYAYDIDADARQLCKAMARLNGIADRVTVRGACDAEELLSIPISGRGLIISDCGGYEK